jgi:RNA polymerase subunit RPABC4/transcription elongation factor Spt4
MTFCHKCGKRVVPPFTKFCRSCGAPQWEEAQQQIIPARTPVTESPAEPLQGNTPSLPQSRNSIPPSPQVHLEPVTSNPCRSCSSPINADEKYCGICGSPRGEHDLTVLYKQEILMSAHLVYAPRVVHPFLKRENSERYAVRV